MFYQSVIGTYDIVSWDLLHLVDYIQALIRKSLKLGIRLSHLLKILLLVSIEKVLLGVALGIVLDLLGANLGLQGLYI